MYQKVITSPIGNIYISASDKGLTEVLFMDEDTRHAPDTTGPFTSNHICETTALQLAEYFAGKRTTFDIPLSPAGTPFQQHVWQQLLMIPFGKTTTYSGIANQMNNPLSVRAVGLANGKNPKAIVIPCHRVIGVDGSLTGYAGGLKRKEALLKIEGNASLNQPGLWD